MVVHGVVAVRRVQNSHGLASATEGTTRLSELQVVVAILAFQAVLECGEEGNVDTGQRRRVVAVYGFEIHGRNGVDLQDLRVSYGHA